MRAIGRRAALLVRGTPTGCFIDRIEQPTPPLDSAAAVHVDGNGDDLEVGIKENEGWKALVDDSKIWSSLNLSTKDASQRNNLIFMSIDKWEELRSTIPALRDVPIQDLMS